jgi:hypothetical protein
MKSESSDRGLWARQDTLYSWFQTFAVFWILYAFFCVIPRRLNLICQRFGTLYLFHLHRRVGEIQTPGNYPEESIQHSLFWYKKYNSIIVTLFICLLILHECSWSARIRLVLPKRTPSFTFTVLSSLLPCPFGNYNIATCTNYKRNTSN